MPSGLPEARRVPSGLNATRGHGGPRVGDLDQVDRLDQRIDQRAVIRGLRQSSCRNQLLVGADRAAGTGTGQHRLGLGDQPQAGCLAETRVGLLARDVCLVPRVVGLCDAQSHRHDGDDGGDRQQRDEDPGAFPQRGDAVVFAPAGKPAR